MATILCIEDEVHLREDIADELQDAGYETYEARDGVEGLQMIVRHKPDLVISDISMPRMDGHQLVQELREKHPELSEMPFIFLSALTDREDVMDGLKFGGDDYLTKPVDYELLRIKVGSALRQSGRMIEHKKQEQERLYKALAQPHREPAAAPPKTTLPARKIVLVGTSDPGLWEVQRQLENLGQHVRVFTSGRAFLDKVEKVEASLILLWLQSDDMQAPMIATLNKSSGTRTILVVPKALAGPMAKVNAKGVHDTVVLPLTERELVSKLTSWTSGG